MTTNSDKYPFISIIIPTFNSEKFIKETLDSLYQQNYNYFEVIVVDGGSSDSTLTIINEYKNLNIKIISGKDFGLVHAVNKGVMNANGEYLLWLNSDDLLFPDALLKVCNYLAENPNIDLLYGNTAQINESGIFLGWHAEPYDKKRLLNERCFIPCQSTFFRKSALAYIGLFDTSLLWAADWDMWKRFAINDDKFRIVFLDEKIGKWRIHRNTISYGGGSKEYVQKHIEILKNTRKYSTKILTFLEIKLLVHILIGFLGLRIVLRNIRDFLNNVIKK